jgi:hypothetical protein
MRNEQLPRRRRCQRRPVARHFVAGLPPPPFHHRTPAALRNRQWLLGSRVPASPGSGTASSAIPGAAASLPPAAPRSDPAHRTRARVPPAATLPTLCAPDDDRTA